MKTQINKNKSKTHHKVPYLPLILGIERSFNRENEQNNAEKTFTSLIISFKQTKHR